MSSTPLPRQVDIRKLIAADTEISVREPLQKFARLATMLATDDGLATEDGLAAIEGGLAKDTASKACDVEVKLHLYVDEGGNKRIDGEVHTRVTVLCQRCMQPLQLPIDSTFAVAAVWSDDEASRLPKYLEPYIVGEGPQDMRDLIEDELILCVPYASYHEREDCAGNYRQSVADKMDETVTEEKPNPFQVLRQLKPGKKAD